MTPKDEQDAQGTETFLSGARTWTRMRKLPEYPQQALGEHKEAQSNDSTWAYHRHDTISRDQTHGSSFEQERLAALKQGLQGLPRPSTPHSPIMKPLQPRVEPSASPAPEVVKAPKILSSGNPRSRLPPDPQPLESLQQLHQHNPGNEGPGLAESNPPLALHAIRQHNSIGDLGSSTNDATSQISQLEEQIREIRRLQNSLRSTTWQVIHKIENDPTSYLVEPSWISGQQRGLLLKGNSPLPDASGYLRYRSDLGFVVYKYYEHDHQSKEIESAQAAGSMLPSPIPVRESIQLLSPQMISAIDALMNTHPSFKKIFPDWQSKDLMESPFLFWFHYRSSLSFEALSELHKRQAQLLTRWINQHYNQIYAEAETQFSLGYVRPSTIKFLFRPGDVLISVNHQDLRGYISDSYVSDSDPSSDDDEPLLAQQSRSKHMSRHSSIDAWSYQYDGQFYRQSIKLFINFKLDKGRSDIKIENLKVLPLRFVSGELYEKLVRRGEIIWECRKRKLVSYQDQSITNAAMGEERYMIDIKTHQQLHSSSSESNSGSKRSISLKRKEMDAKVMDCDVPPQGPELFALPSTLVGYNLRQKKWQDLQVDLVEKIVWNKKAFAHLVIDGDTKDIIQALITSNLETQQGTDMIRGKGNGLIILLHGGPGTGKTFTAESVAEMAERPLFRVTCGDIGTKPEEVEKYLESVLHLGKIWGCVVLLDEADVFLEQRTLTDLERNALVSVFLRVIEYYEGILILTSNRVGTFDEAFKSRIQLSLHYEPLGKSQRRKIWENFLDRLKTTESENTEVEPITERKRKLEGTEEIDFDEIERHLGELAAEELNGRQIRNAITTARQLAKFKHEDMKYKHLEHVMKISKKFDKYLEKVQDNYTDDQVARGEGIR